MECLYPVSYTDYQLSARESKQALKSTKDLLCLYLTRILRQTMKINAVFVFYTLYISLTQRIEKIKYKTNCIKLSKALSKIRAQLRH